MINKSLTFNGNQSFEMSDIPGSQQFFTFLNNTGYNVTLYQDGNLIFSCPIYTILTIPLTPPDASMNYNYRLDVVGTGAADFRGIFTDFNLGLNQSLVTPGGSSSTLIVGDSIGLAKQANQVTINNTLLALAAKFPAAFTAGGGLKVGVVDALPAGDNNIGNVGIVTLPALSAGTNNIGDVDVLTLPALPAGTNNIGDVDVLTLPALPAGTNNIGDVDVLTLPALPAGTNNIGDVDVLTVGVGEVVKPKQTPVIYNVTMTSANTEYSQALPANCRAFSVSVLTGDAIARIAFVTGKVAGSTAPYMQIATGGQYFEDNCQIANQTLYFASPTAGKVMQIVAWS